MEIGKEIKQRKFSSSQQKAITNVIYTNNWLLTNIKAMLKPFGITQQQYNVLRILNGKHPAACSSSEVKEVMLDKTPDLTRLIDRLIKKNLVQRDICHENRRKVDIHITAEGLALVQKILPISNRIESTLCKLSDDDSEVLSELLDRMRNSNN